MKFVLIFSTLLALSVSAIASAEATCGKQPPSNTVKISGSQASALFDSMDARSAQSGIDSIGRLWFTQKSKSVELSQCSVGDCTYTRSRVSRCVKGFNGRTDCTQQDESSYYCIDNR